MDLLIVGNAGGTNVGASLQRAATASELTSRLIDARSATAGACIAQAVSWRFFDHRPLRLKEFSRNVIELCKRDKPAVLIATGMVPLTSASLREISLMNIFLVNYLTDDPWNPAFSSRWFLSSLKAYDRVYSPRRSNLPDLERHGCPHAGYLPFGYDESLWLLSSGELDKKNNSADVFFAGAADRFRVSYMEAFAKAGIRLALAGDYWRRHKQLRPFTVGHLNAGELKAHTRSTPVSICLVRRTNRDGHVMRSFEIPAIGACMIAEDTREHREIFGQDGVAVRYFASPADAVKLVQELLADEPLRHRLAAKAQQTIISAGNSYRDRLASLLLDTPLAERSVARQRLSKENH